MGIPIVAGRGFTSTDTATAPKVAVINQTLARRYFPDTNPIGKTFRGYYFVDKTPFQIVGICADARYNSLRNPPPATYYVIYGQLPRTAGEMTYEVRTRVKPASLVPALRRAVQAADKNLPLINVRSQAEQIDETIRQEKLLAELTAAFGILALALACIGIYGIMAYTVARRTNEIGVRIAMGAQTRQILGMILNETAKLALVGILVGLGSALLVARLLRTMLFGLKPDDPITLASAAVLLLTVALIAGFVPALRASRVEPMQALRSD
jgi:predicted permease